MSALLEIVELSDGRIALLRVGSEEEPLIIIKFSERAKDHLSGATLKAGQFMIQTALEAIMGKDSEVESGKHTLH